MYVRILTMCSAKSDVISQGHTFKSRSLGDGKGLSMVVVAVEDMECSEGESFMCDSTVGWTYSACRAPDM